MTQAALTIKGKAMTLKNLVVLVSVILAACSKAPDGSEFIGKWQNNNEVFGSTIIEIAKNENLFLFIVGKVKYHAVLTKDNTLQILCPGHNRVITYVKSSNTIMDNGVEFNRVKW
jgi:uncharacterized lipoprotein YajG